MLPREPIETLLRFRDWLTDLATPRCIAPSENVYYQGPQTGQNLCPQNSTSLQLSAVFLLPFTPDVLYPVHLKQLSSPRRMGPSIPCLFCVPSFPRPFPSFSTRLTWLALEHLRRHLLRETSLKPRAVLTVPTEQKPITVVTVLKSICFCLPPRL